jgi:hypothetical protein
MHLIWRIDVVPVVKVALKLLAVLRPALHWVRQLGWHQNEKHHIEKHRIEKHHIEKHQIERLTID